MGQRPADVQTPNVDEAKSSLWRLLFYGARPLLLQTVVPIHHFLSRSKTWASQDRDAGPLSGKSEASEARKWSTISHTTTALPSEDLLSVGAWI